MKTKRNHEGYLILDHRASPGTYSDNPEIVTAPEGACYESATITCSHCHRVVILNPQRTRARGYCRSCDHYVCDSPGCNTGTCVPFNKLLDEISSGKADRAILLKV